MKMTATRAQRRKRKIALSQERSDLRYKMKVQPFETEDGLKEQTKIGGELRETAARGSWNK